jgi:hypothetical protein
VQPDNLKSAGWHLQEEEKEIGLCVLVESDTLPYFHLGGDEKTV